MSFPTMPLTNGEPSRVMWGVTVYSGSTRLAELAGKIGFDVVWIEMEHGPTDFAAAENICYAVKASGALPAVRVPSGQRHHILRALEIGVRIVIVPMVNTADEAAQVVRHGKFPPLGMRGFNNRTPGTGFGLAGVESMLLETNSDTSLFVQIETREAVENLDAICRVEGLTGILVGPYDLSMSCDMTGRMDHPQLIDMVATCIRKARLAGKQTAILVTPGPMMDAVIEAGCQLVICGGDVANLTNAWTEMLARLNKCKSRV